jgi:hypothetical protein
MIKNLIYYSIVAFSIYIVLIYACNVGARAGEENYKHSKEMFLALESAYQYGLQDCLRGGH